MYEVDITADHGGRFQMECPNCGALLKFYPNERKVLCHDYDGLPYGCNTEFEVESATVELRESREAGEGDV